MARLYHRLFYQLHCFFSDLNAEGWEEWKALVFVNTMCLLLSSAGWMLLSCAVKLGTGAPLPYAPTWVLVVVTSVISLGNYKFFLGHDRWQAYAAQFKAEPVSNQRRAAWGAFAAVLAVLGSIVGSFYCYGLLMRG